MKRLSTLLILSILSGSALASAEIRSSSRASCEQTDFQPYELSLSVTNGDDNYDYYDNNDYRNTYNDEQRVELEFSYSFGGADQIDCSRFQSLVEREQEANTRQLELKVAELEAKLLKQQTLRSKRVEFK